MNKDYHNITTSETIEGLKTNEHNGLTMSEATSRIAQNGPNRLDEAKKKHWIFKILAQFKDFLVIILIIAAIISIVVGGDWIDGSIIIAILIINVIIGLVQENKADNALKELKAMSAPKAKVLRDGVVDKIDSSHLVVGDIVMLDAGDYIPADVRIIESINMRVDESALTGESITVEKNADITIPADAPLGDRINLAFMGTVVNYGRGKAVVCATGMDTEMGKIASILNQVEDTQTPLQTKLDSMAKRLGIVLILTCAIVFAIGFLRGMDLVTMFMTSVSLAVAAVPEGIAIVTTMILALGVHRMVRSNVIIKKMRAVEALGSTTVICSDKTGTLTQNKMTVVKVFDYENIYEVSGTGYSADGAIAAHIPLTTNIHKMAEIAVLCNDSSYDVQNAQIIGDPTEAAMLVLGEKAEKNRDTLHNAHKRIREIPFDSERKLMSTYNLINGEIIMNTKGAPDEIIRRSEYYLKNGEILPMTDEVKQNLITQNENFAKQALRVLGFSYKKYESETQLDDEEQDLIYVGMMCMIDPPRVEAKDAIANCHHAGIIVKMITGDHKITASAIGKALGILKDKDIALEGVELNNLSDEKLIEKVRDINVFARVSPEHKVRIVSALKADGNIVAMTGDGVNDAPSLKRADIGIAMGITGTDVSKEAADMILTDDNFVSIVSAVEQGRTIYNNIRKVVGYLLSANIGEILIILLAIVFGLPVPLVATQLLFVNLLTDAFPAFALGMEGKEADIMSRKPRDPKEPIINGIMRKTILFKCIFLSAGVLGAFLYGLHFYSSYDNSVAITLAFFTLVSSELLVTYTARTEGYIGLNKSIFANIFLNRSILISFVILFATIYVPVLNQMLTTVPLSPTQLGISFVFSLIPIIGSELSKRLKGGANA
ncbi:MAG: cation-translocating P-type ATPase [Defluviitaleaceae bacterium]|nr:cation-translocating P-type ATPase [Defluviitaleaceae bacterium]